MNDQPVVDASPASSVDAAMNPGVAVQYAIHAAVRRDMDRLIVALGTDSVPEAAVADYAESFLFQLHHHHTFEDDEVWPLLRERLGDSSTELLDRNLDEHADVVASVDAFAAELNSLGIDRASALAAAERMRDVVDLHLRHEEADVIPLIPQAFVLEDIARFQAISAEQNPAPVFLPWVLESAPTPIASGFGAALPPPVQQLLGDAWMPVWQAKVDALA